MSHMCYLHKSFYGLKQAPQVWYNHLSDYLLFIGFYASKINTSLFILFVASDIIYLLVYVDDILLTRSNSTLIAKYSWTEWHILINRREGLGN
jgi:hypothetical protein